MIKQNLKPQFFKTANPSEPERNPAEPKANPAVARNRRVAVSSLLEELELEDVLDEERVVVHLLQLGFDLEEIGSLFLLDISAATEARAAILGAWTMCANMMLRDDDTSGDGKAPSSKPEEDENEEEETEE